MRLYEGVPAQPLPAVVVGGPGSRATVPGVAVAEVACALSSVAEVSQIEIDLDLKATVGLHRAKSLAALHQAARLAAVAHDAARPGWRFAERAWLRDSALRPAAAVAYVWPGIDNGWLTAFLRAADRGGALPVALCASLPGGGLQAADGHAEAGVCAGVLGALARAQLVVVGDREEAAELAGMLGGNRAVEWHPALSFRHRGAQPVPSRVVSFVPRGDSAGLRAMLAAFDAIPAARVGPYHLTLAVRGPDRRIEAMVAASYHSRHVTLVEEYLTRPELVRMCAEASAVVIASPAPTSRAYAAAVEAGVATVVVSSSRLPPVGAGYLGALLADADGPSVYVALSHALRLGRLGFPHPASWVDLARHIEATLGLEAAGPGASEMRS